LNAEFLQNLLQTGALAHDPNYRQEFKNYLDEGISRLGDAKNKAKFNPNDRFEFAISAFAQFAFAAMRWHGFRSNVKMYGPHTIRCLEHTVDLGQWSAVKMYFELQKHNEENEKHWISSHGHIGMTSEVQVKEAIRCADLLLGKVKALGPI
jgi:hypothetical protein